MGCQRRCELGRDPHPDQCSPSLRRALMALFPQMHLKVTRPVLFLVELDAATKATPTTVTVPSARALVTTVASMVARSEVLR